MATPASHLFNGAAIPAEIVVLGGAAIEGADGCGMVRVPGAGGHNAMPNWSGGGRLRIAIAAGDFDVAVVLGMLLPGSSIGGALLTGSIGFGKADGTDGGEFWGWEQSVYAGNWGTSKSMNGYGGGSGFTVVPGAHVQADDGIARVAMRLVRVGTTLYVSNPANAGAGSFAWNAPSLFNGIADPFAGGACCLYVTSYEVSFVQRVRAFLNLSGLVDGLPAAPVAPTGGVAFSAPDAVGYGVGFVWNAAPANTSRIVEILTATNAGFTTGVRRVVRDRLMDGEKPAHRYTAALGTAVYAKARFIDELGQPGAWSATVNATADAPVVIPDAPTIPDTLATDPLDVVMASYLSQDAGLKALIGDPPRAYMDAVPMGKVRPCVTYFRVVDPLHDHLAGTCALRETHYQFDVWGQAGRTEHRAVVLALRACLRRVSGTLGGAVFVQTIQLSATADSSETPDDEGGETALLRSRMDFVVWWEPV